MTVYRPHDEAQLFAIRKTIIVAIASDDVLMDRLVLKGGNALDIVYELGNRSSLDVDFSMADDVSGSGELEEIKDRLFRALRDRFDSLQPVSYVVFDYKFEHRPRLGSTPTTDGALPIWGGYNATFKLVGKERYLELGGIPGVVPDGRLLEALRRQSQVTGPSSERSFTIEISKFEYTAGKVVRTIDGFDCYVYTPAMMASEKLRAICQQLPEYQLRRHPSPRPRDFFDIHTIVTGTGLDLTAHLSLLREIFAAKEVPVALLDRIADVSVRDFHAQEWASVEISVRGDINQFDTYYSFVVGEAKRVSSLLHNVNIA